MLKIENRYSNEKKQELSEDNIARLLGPKMDDGKLSKMIFSNLSQRVLEIHPSQVYILLKPYCLAPDMPSQLHVQFQQVPSGVVGEAKVTCILCY